MNAFSECFLWIIEESFSSEESQRANKICRLYKSSEFLKLKKAARVRLKGLNSLIKIQIIKLRKKSEHTT